MKTVAALAVAAALSACLHDPAEPADVDGQAAWQWVHDIVYDGDGLRPRHPGHPDQNDTVRWLADALAVPGWDVSTSSFGGETYSALAKPAAVRGYVGPSSPYCSDDDWGQLPGLWFTNLVATLPGAGQGHAMIGAHWDAKEDADEGHPPVPAANDGASGVGLLLQLQRHIHEHEVAFPFDLSFVFFDGEDGFDDCHPLAGSIHYAATQELPDRFILLDMVGDADARFPREGRSLQSDPALVDLIWSKAPDHGLGDNFVQQQKSVLDDHLPFIEAGVPSVDIVDFARPAGEGRSGFPPYWHTEQDTPDRVDPAMLGRMGDLLVDVVRDDAFAQWP